MLAPSMMALVARVEMVNPIIAPASQDGVSGRRGPAASLLLRIIVNRLLFM
jgi:hypothetical protein